MAPLYTYSNFHRACCDNKMNKLSISGINADELLYYNVSINVIPFDVGCGMWDILHSCCYCCFQLIPNILIDFRLGGIRKFPIHNKLNVNLCYLRLMLKLKGLQGVLGNLNGACYSIHFRLNSASSIKCHEKHSHSENQLKNLFIFGIISNLRFSVCV